MDINDNKSTKMVARVNGDGSVDLNTIEIELIQGGWHAIVYPIYKDNKVIDETLTLIRKGLYTLIIRYGDELITDELMIYENDPDWEVLTFNFFKEHKRIFCRMTSFCAHHLNKLLVLDDVDDETKAILKELNNNS